jgi:hypothetical protein
MVFGVAAVLTLWIVMDIERFFVIIKKISLEYMYLITQSFGLSLRHLIQQERILFSLVVMLSNIN